MIFSCRDTFFGARNNYLIIEIPTAEAFRDALKKLKTSSLESIMVSVQLSFSQIQKTLRTPASALLNFCTPRIG